MAPTTRAMAAAGMTGEEAHQIRSANARNRQVDPINQADPNNEVVANNQAEVRSQASSRIPERLPNASEIFAMNRPQRNNGAAGSRRSSRSSRLRQQLAVEEELIQIRDQERQLNLEAERLADRRRLILLRSEIIEEENEEDEEERRSNVLSNSSGGVDVHAWAEHQANSVRNGIFQQQTDGHLPRAQSANAPIRTFSRTSINAQNDDELKITSKEEPNSFKKMADSIASAINGAIQAVRPNDDMKIFVARQTGAKDLPDFHGEPEEWPTFEARFRRSTELCGFSDEENVIRLQKCLKGKAKESVQSMLSSAANLSDILDVLKKRFGRPEQIIKRMIERARNLASPVEGDFQSLVDFAIGVKNLCATAESLQLPLYLNNPQLVEEFRKKLPYSLQLEWSRQVIKTGKSTDLKELSLFLDEVSSAAVLMCDTAIQQQKKKKECFMAVTDLRCGLGCEKDHSLAFCPKFKKMKIHERWAYVKKQRMCFTCLDKGHSSYKCPLPVACDVRNCTGLHHPLLHQDVRKDHNKEPAKFKKEENPKEKKEATATTTVEKHTFGVIAQGPSPLGNVLIKVVPVILRNGSREMLVNAFLDPGSTLTMIEADVAEWLGLSGSDQPLYLKWQGGKEDHDEDSKNVSLCIRGIDEKEEFTLDNVRTKNNLMLPIQPMSSYKSLKRWSHLENVPYPEVLRKRPVIVIGLPHSYLTLGRKNVEGPRNAPIASWTYLGWVVYGPNGRPGPVEKSAAMMAVENVDPDAILHELVKEQFRLESLGVVNCKKLPQSKQNERADQIMEETSRRVGDRWETGMLWKTDDLELPESWKAAMSRLRILEKKMDKDVKYAEMYQAKIDEYITKEFCRKLSPEEAAVENGRVWYLPHFGTTNPNKPGKLRFVFDCAAKVNGSSLNDALLQGPDLMSPLINVLLKFRQREVGFSGDIRDMFHMVRIRQEDVPALRFLWRGKDRSRTPDVYQMDVMIFGAVSSPYQAQWIKNRNAKEFEDEYPEAADAILNRHYVDDYLDSCSTTEAAIQKIMQVREIHRRGGFEIRGWLSNDQDVLKVVSPTDQNVEETLQLKAEDKLERVLGLFWDPKSDSFKFKTVFRNIDAGVLEGKKLPTKREFLRLIMSLFDPLGFIAHLTVRGRMLMQDIWRNDTNWDERLKSEQEPKWKIFLNQVVKISEVVIPRCFAPLISDCEEIQLHVMCDASQQAFSCVAYLRCTGRGRVNVNIVMAKARVAPVKVVSIPRLEMEAALIGARMAIFIRKNLDLQISRTVLWSDSRNVLCWIRAEDPGRYKTYIAHRIGEILELTDKRDWRWVPTADNVADDATRDCSSADLTPESRWFCGPGFLWEPESQWPVEVEKLLDGASAKDLELRKEHCLLLVEADIMPKVERFSSWMRLTRTTAWILRVVNHSLAIRGEAEKKTGCLSVAEIRNATMLWVQKVQEECFEEELVDLKEGRQIGKSSKLYGLSPTMKDGVICVNTRLVNSPNLPTHAMYPPILDPSHPWTKLLVSWYHHIFGHHGIEKIFNELRQRYWILGGKGPVKKAAKECLLCRMDRAKQVPPQMAALPGVRVTQPSRPFTFTGVDYFGPLDVTVGRKHDKRYGVLFTCLSTRAVHLEVAHSLSTDDFLMALHRFISRRGEPEELWSDNGTNFRGADRELKNALKEVDTRRIEDEMTNQGIKWTFNPPGAPHMGGAWERLVRSVKTAMTTILKNRSLTDQVLLTVLAEAEASVNSRPLTTVSTDKDDSEAITPNCFLIGTTGVKQPPGVFDDGDLSLRKRWRHAQVLANHFWSRWLKEYLPSLSLRAKWNRDSPDIVLGELVFIPDPNQLRNQWMKGVVVAVYPGKDKRVRVVDVKTTTGIIKRPVANLYRIPDWNQESDSGDRITGRGLL